MFEPNTPSYRNRTDFERNAFLLSEMIIQKKLQMNISMKGNTGLEKVRIVPNGRININTIDERVRSMMHMMGGMLKQMNQENLKNEKEK